MSIYKSNPTSKSRFKSKTLTNHFLNTTTKIASTGAESTIRYLAKNHTNSNNHLTFMQNRQHIRYGIANMNLGTRRVQRLLDQNQRLIDTGAHPSMLEIVFGWLIDHALYVWDLFWGFISPILMHLLMSLYTIFLIILFNAIFFGGLIFLLTS